MSRPAAETNTSSGTRHAPGDARRALLDKAATTAGTLWAQRWCDELRKEGRPVVGGWPGTLREARAQVSAYLGTSLGKRKLSFTREELEPFFNLDYHTKHVDTIFRRVFGTAADVGPVGR